MGVEQFSATSTETSGTERSASSTPDSDPLLSGVPLSDTSLCDTSLSDPSLSDAELTALALAADPGVQPDDDAVPFGVGDRGAALLPEWYMPATLRGDAFGTTPRRRAWTVGGIVVAMLIVNGAGLCVTYGLPEIAW